MSPENNNASMPPRMERPPEARSFEIGKLMELASQGRLRVPHFQRAFRWKNQDRVTLFDSIERGYPIGTLLLWKRSAKVPGGLLDGVPTAPQEGDTYWIVDGQQRIKTLWDALGSPPAENAACLCFHVEDQQFRFLPVTDAASIGCVPLFVTLDATELSQWVVEKKWPPEQMRRAFELGKRIRQYSIPAYIVDANDESPLRHIFDRINSSGKSLTRDEVFDAFAGTTLAIDETKSLDRVNERLEDLRFGSYERNTILNTFEALYGLRVGKVKPQAISPEAAAQGLDATTGALRQVAEFFRSSAHIPHALLVPYQLPVVVLARFFHFFPAPAPRSRVLLRRWIWRASLAQLLTGASGSLQEHIDDITANDEHGSVQRLLDRSGRTANDESPTGLRPFSLASAVGRLQASALLGLRPRDLRTGEILNADELFAEGIDRAVRPIIAGSDRDKSNVHVRTIANRLIHPTIKGLGPARLLVGATDIAAQASHAVSQTALSALQQGDLQLFLEIRAQIVEPWIKSFFARHAEWNADDSPPLAALRTKE